MSTGVFEKYQLIINGLSSIDAEDKILIWLLMVCFSYFTASEKDNVNIFKA